MIMTSRSRVARGAETQRTVAGYLAAHGWPYATDAGSGRQGTDVLNTPGLVWEVKARRNFDLPASLRQASRHGPGLPLVVVRPDGFGPTMITSWGLILPFGRGIELLHDAGYGDPVKGDA
jgi:hypothetical protein